MTHLFTITLLLTFQALSLGDITLSEAKKNAMRETLQNYIHHSSIIVDICVYEQAWIQPSKSLPKGQLIQRAIVTHVHCGSLKIGDRVEYIHYIEDAPKLFGRFTATVPVELRTFFYNPDRSEKIDDGILKIEGDGHWGFNRVGDVFAEIFALELKSNPKLINEAKRVAPTDR